MWLTNGWKDLWAAHIKRVQYNKKYELALAQCFRLGKHACIVYRGWLEILKQHETKTWKVHVWERLMGESFIISLYFKVSPCLHRSPFQFFFSLSIFLSWHMHHSAFATKILQILLHFYWSPGSYQRSIQEMLSDPIKIIIEQGS